MVGKPLPTSLHSGVDISVIALWLGHWSENRPRLGARQHPVARQRLRVLGAVVSWPR